jgi:hypothetical protein
VNTRSVGLRKASGWNPFGEQVNDKPANENQTVSFNRRQFVATTPAAAIGIAVKRIAQTGAPAPRGVILVSNFHPVSCRWLTTFSRERVYCANSNLDHLARVRDDPHYAFVMSEVNNFIAIMNFQAERIPELKQRIQEKRVELVNGFFLESSINLSGGEALVRDRKPVLLLIASKVRKNRFTLNVGVRWHANIWPVYGYLDNGQGYFGDMNLTNGTYVVSAIPPACSSTRPAPCIPGGTLPANVVLRLKQNRALHNTDWKDWQARIGFAYHPFKKSSILGGYGRFYDNWSVATQIYQNVGGTWPSVTLQNANTLNTNVPNASIGDPFNPGSSIIQPAATPLGNAIFYYNPNMRLRVPMNGTLVLSKSGKDTVMPLTDVRAIRTQLDLGGLHNTAQFPAAGTIAQVAARRPYPYIVPTNFDDSTGNGNYNSMQATLRRSTSKGLTYPLSYTWSKSIDLACSVASDERAVKCRTPIIPEQTAASQDSIFPRSSRDRSPIRTIVITAHRFPSARPVESHCNERAPGRLGCEWDSEPDVRHTIPSLLDRGRSQYRQLFRTCESGRQSQSSTSNAFPMAGRLRVLVTCAVHLRHLSPQRSTDGLV